jgi:hypothetical protein
MCPDGLKCGCRRERGVGKYALPQFLSEGDMPHGAFWLETNTLWGWVWEAGHWETAKAAFVEAGREDLAKPERHRQAAWAHWSGAAGVRSFGTREEHIGERTLLDHAKEFNLEWLV